MTVDLFGLLNLPSPFIKRFAARIADYICIVACMYDIEHRQRQLPLWPAAFWGLLRGIRLFARPILIALAPLGFLAGKAGDSLRCAQKL